MSASFIVILIIIIIFVIATSSTKEGKNIPGNKDTGNQDMNISRKSSNTSYYNEAAHAAKISELQQHNTHTIQALEQRVKQQNYASERPRTNYQTNRNESATHEAKAMEYRNLRIKREAELAETRKKQEEARKKQEIEELRMKLAKEKAEEEKKNHAINQVKKYSERYNSLIHLFQDYQLWEDVKTEFHLSTQYDSPTAFISLEESEILARVASNKQLKATYELIKMNRTSVSDFMSKAPAKITSEYNIRNSGLAEDQFLAIEKDLLSELQKRLKVDISLTVIAICPYMSEKGIKSFTYSYEDLDHFYSQQNTMQINAEEERGKMTPSLRYAVMQRDGFRCVLCGASAQDGAKLHVDHVLPVSKGGKTEISNLRTLCDRCNLGKGAKYDPSGIN